LLEDIEWQARLMLAGVDVGYAPQARVYDEKTRRATQLSRQRRRWVAGVAIAARTYGGRMLASGIRTRNPRQLIAGFAVTKPPRSVLLLLMAALALGGWLFPGAPGLLPWPFWTAALGSFGLYVLLGMALDGARPRAYLALLAAPVFAAMMIGTSAAGALRASKQQWIPTTHERGIGLDQLRSQ
jgi:cellulose synthase/poly-beta-1,6-N-acetylglucosamine synthase-like glycosyltransferase